MVPLPAHEAASEPVASSPGSESPYARARHLHDELPGRPMIDSADLIRQARDRDGADPAPSA